MTKYILLIPFIVLTLSSFAKIWTFDDCIIYAFKNNLNLKIQQNNLMIADLNVSESKWSMAPTVNASGNSNFDMRRSTNQNNDISAGASYSVGTNIRASMNLFSGFRTINNIKAQHYLKNAKEQNTEEQKKRLYLQILNLYTDIIYQQELIVIAENKLAESQKQVEELSTLIEVGKREAVALDEIEAYNSGNELLLLKANNNLKLKKIELTQLLQIPQTNEFEIDSSGFKYLEPFKKNLNVEMVYQKALQVTATIKEHEYLMQYYQTQLAIRKGALAPSVSASGGYGSRFYSTDTLANGKTTPFTQQMEKYLNPSLGISLNIPIFNGRSRNYAIKRSRIQLENQLFQLQDEKNNVLKEIELAIQSLEVNRLEYINSVKYLEFAQKSFQSSKEKYSLGLINSTEFLITQNQLASAQTNVINAKLNWVVQEKIINLFIEGNLAYQQ